MDKLKEIASKLYDDAFKDGYQQGIEEGMRFAEWVLKSTIPIPHPGIHILENDRAIVGILNAPTYTTAELFELFKKEQP